MNSFRWGILGTGGIAKTFAKDIQLLPGHTVSSVGSRDLSSALKFSESFAGSQPYGSYAELIESNVDAIYIATPHPMHFENALMAMQAGKPVLCEKPFTLNAQEARELIVYSQKYRIPLMEGMWTRFLPHIKQVQKIIESDALGEIHTLIADHGQFIPPSRAPRLWEPELGGGALLDLGIYPITIADIALGPPQEIHAHATLTEKWIDLQTSMGFTYPNGAHALLTCTMANQSANTAVISGEKARLEIDGPFFAPTSFRLITRDGNVTTVSNDYQGVGLREEAAAFAEVIRVGSIESPLMTHAKTLEIMELMDAVRKLIGVRYPGESLNAS